MPPCSPGYVPGPNVCKNQLGEQTNKCHITRRAESESSVAGTCIVRPGTLRLDLGEAICLLSRNGCDRDLYGLYQVNSVRYHCCVAQLRDHEYWYRG